MRHEPSGRLIDAVVGFDTVLAAPSWAGGSRSNRARNSTAQTDHPDRQSASSLGKLPGSVFATKNRMKHLLVIAILAAAAGCTDELVDESAVVQEQGTCTSIHCNSPELAHYGLWEANIHGLPDVDGVAIRSLNGNAYLTKGTTRYSLYVANGQLFGWYFNKLTMQVVTISGTALVGSEIELVRNGTPYYTIYIAAVHRTASFVVGAPSTIETYGLRWHEPGTLPSSGKNLCNEVLAASPYNKQFELAGMYPDDTLLFEGDRYDPDKKTTAQGANTDWFNFGCAGHTLAKLYVTRSTYFTQPQPDWAMRQTMLKALSADYCGAGTPYTLAGEPLVWKGGPQQDFVALPAGHSITSLDARWYEGGAICYDEPRIKVTTNLGVIGTPLADPETAIRAECPQLPKCTNHDWTMLDGAKLVTANWVP